MAGMEGRTFETHGGVRRRAVDGSVGIARRGLLCLALFGMLLLSLTACGGELGTTLTIGDDLSGERRMVYEVDLSDNRGHYSGTPEEITAAVEAGCPSELLLATQVSENNVTYTFTLAFSDLAEYERKVRALLELGGSGTAGPGALLEYSAPDAIFATGVTYRESFTSQELMKWFESLLVEQGVVSEGDRENIFYRTWLDYDVQGAAQTNASSVDFSYARTFTPAEAQITLSLQKGGTVAREVTLRFTDTLKEEELERLRERLAERTDGTGIEVAKCDGGRSGLTAVLRSEGTPEEEAQAWNEAFGGSSALEVTRDTTFVAALSYTTHLEDAFDLGALARATFPEVTYTVKGIGKTAAFGGDAESEKGNSFVRTYADYDAAVGPVLRNDLTGRRTNVAGWLIWTGAAAIVLIALIWWIRRRVKLRKDRRSRKSEEVPVPAPAPEPASSASQPPSVQRMYCSECGSRLSAGSRFCENCGSKV